MDRKQEGRFAAVTRCLCDLTRFHNATDVCSNFFFSSISHTAMSRRADECRTHTHTGGEMYILIEYACFKVMGLSLCLFLFHFCRPLFEALLLFAYTHCAQTHTGGEACSKHVGFLVRGLI